MPRKILLLLFVWLLMLPILPAYAGMVFLDGKILANVSSLPIEDKLMVPVRPIFEEMGYRLSYNIDEGIIKATKGQNEIEIDLWEPKLILDGENIEPAAAPQLVSGSTLLAVEDINKLLGLKVNAEQTTSISFFSKPEMSKEGVIRHLFTADRQMMRAEYYNNQAFLIENRIEPSPKIVSRDDLQRLLAEYWAPDYIESLWEAGSKEGCYDGFYSEGAIPLLYSKEISIADLTATGAKVVAKLPAWGEEGLSNFEERIYTLNQDKTGNLLITNIECHDIIE